MIWFEILKYRQVFLYCVLFYFIFVLYCVYCGYVF
jgi:hypothetical protein